MPILDNLAGAILCSARAAARSLLLSVSFRFRWETSEGGASRCLGLLAEVSTLSNDLWFVVRVRTRIGDIS